MSEGRTTLTFSDLRPYLLLENGNYLYKVPFRGGFAVLKVYYGSHGPLARWGKSLANVLLYGQTSYAPRTRRRVERRCLALWARHGFRTFGVHDGVRVQAPGCPEDGYLLLEFVERPRLCDVLADRARPLAERLALWRRFLAEWSRRHELAIARREPDLVHENGDGKHVMLLEDGGFLWFDFEMVFRSRRRVRRQVAHETIQYLWQICRRLDPDEVEALLEETVRAHPRPERLREAWELFLKHPNLLMRAARWLDQRRARARKPTSKYRIARRLRAAGERLGRAG